MYTVAYLIRLPINIIWGMVGRLAGALLGCIVCLYTNVLAPSDQVEEKEPLPPVGVAISDDEDSDDDDSTIDFGGADPIDDNYDVDCVDVPLLPPPATQAAYSSSKEGVSSSSMASWERRSRWASTTKED